MQSERYSSAEMRLFRKLDASPQFVRDHLLPYDHQTHDPFLTAGYLTVTGRRGLFRLTEADTPCYLLLHPNLRNHVLLLADWLRVDVDALAAAANAVAGQRMTCHLARVPEDAASRLSRLGGSLALKHIPERTLDWAYPVHVVKPDTIVKARGAKFQDVRTALNKYRTRISLRTLQHRDACGHEAISGISRSWLQLRQGTEPAAPQRGYSSSFFESLSRQLVSRLGKTIHMLFSLDGRDIGFLVLELGSPVCLMAAQISVRMKYLNECMYWILAKWCQQRQISELCLGGSESAGLDRFKRKFSPTRSVPLATYEVAPAHRRNLICVEGAADHT